MGRDDEWARAVIVMILLLLLTGFVFVLLSPERAQSHSWYPSDCCSDKDCEPIASERVMENGIGYFVDGGAFFVPHASARVSPDGGYHGCEYNRDKNAPLRLTPSPYKTFRCFFAPPKAT